MERHHYSPEEIAELVHRAKLPTAIWAALLAAACISALFDRSDESAAAPVPVAATVATEAETGLAKP